MPTHDDTVSLSVGGKIHTEWKSYEIDSDLMVPADAFNLTLAPGTAALPEYVVEGAAIQVRVGRDLVLTGFIDDISQQSAKGKHDISINGRDGAGQLLDCSAPIFSHRLQTLKNIATALVRDFGFISIRIDAKKTMLRERVSVEPGDSAWDALSHAAEANGLWPWFEPTGELVIGGPDYTTAPVATLIQRVDGVGNNVEEVTVTRSCAERYSEITVLGQSPGTYLEPGDIKIRGTASDTGVKQHRPRIVIDHDMENSAMALTRAKKLIADARLNALSIEVTVKGHHTAHGVLWKPGQRVVLQFDRERINGIFFLMGRKLVRSRDGGTRTLLRFKEDGIWALDAHPHHRKYRRGRNEVTGTLESGEAPRGTLEFAINHPVLHGDGT